MPEKARIRRQGNVQPPIHSPHIYTLTSYRGASPHRLDAQIPSGPA
jgi:hypothetical protein